MVVTDDDRSQALTVARPQTDAGGAAGSFELEQSRAEGDERRREAASAGAGAHRTADEHRRGHGRMSVTQGRSNRHDPADCRQVDSVVADRGDQALEGPRRDLDHDAVPAGRVVADNVDDSASVSPPLCRGVDPHRLVVAELRAELCTQSGESDGTIERVGRGRLRHAATDTMGFARDA